MAARFGWPGAIFSFQDSPDEARKIADGDEWQHGFHAGVVAFSRLISGLAQTEWFDWSEGTDDPEHPWESPELQRKFAREQYPELDS